MTRSEAIERLVKEYRDEGAFTAVYDTVAGRAVDIVARHESRTEYVLVPSSLGRPTSAAEIVELSEKAAGLVAQSTTDTAVVVFVPSPNSAVPVIAELDRVSFREWTVREPNAETLTICVSGGGCRATAFSCGVLAGLVATGLNRLTHGMTSVSGGSITNAFVYQETSYTTETNPRDFLRRMAPLLDTVANRGFVAAPWVRVLLFIAWSIPAGFVMIRLGALRGAAPGSGAWWLAFLAVAVASVLISGTTVLGIVSVDSDRRLRKLLGEDSKAITFPTSYEASADSSRPYTCVVCATELRTGGHFFFTTEGLEWANKRFRPESPIAGRKAVAASLAFPGFARAESFRVRRLGLEGFVGARMHRRVRLMDGGIRDNLATDWLYHSPTSGAIVIDASQVDDWSDRRPMTRMRSLRRSVRLVHASNTEARRRIFEWAVEVGQMSGAIVRLGATLDDTAPSHPLRANERALDDTLGAIEASITDTKDLTEVVDDIARISTTLDALGLDRTADLVYHGYLLGIVASSHVAGMTAPDHLLAYSDIKEAIGNAD
jgi:hypothetical protein